MATCLENLNEAAWQSLLKEIENRSGDETGQKITSYILEQVDIKKCSEGFKQKGTMFDLAIATLGSANHMNSNRLAHLAIDLIKPSWKTVIGPRRPENESTKPSWRIQKQPL